MRGVEHVPLREVLTPVGNQVELQPDVSYRIAGIYSFGRGLFEREEILGVETSYSTMTRLERDQFVVSKLNGWEGAVDVVSPEVAGCHVSSEYPVFSIDSEAADPAYLRWIARWPAFWDLLVPRGSMVRRKRVQPKQMLEVKVPLPPIAQQRRVAALLDRTQAKAAAIAERVTRSFDLARASQVALAAQGDDARTPSVRLRDVLSPSANVVTVDVAESYRIAGTYSFGNGLIDRGTLPGSETSYRTLTRLDEGNVVVSKLNGWEGAVAVVDRDFAGAHVSGEYPTFAVDRSQLVPGFFKGIARSPAFWAELDRSVRGSMVRRRRISPDDFLAVSIRLPPLEEQRRVAGEIARLDKIMWMGGRSRAFADALLPALVHQEFTALRA